MSARCTIDCSRVSFLRFQEAAPKRIRFVPLREVGGDRRRVSIGSTGSHTVTQLWVPRDGQIHIAITRQRGMRSRRTTWTDPFPLDVLLLLLLMRQGECRPVRARCRTSHYWTMQIARVPSVLA